MQPSGRCPCRGEGEHRLDLLREHQPMLCCEYQQLAVAFGHANGAHMCMSLGRGKIAPGGGSVWPRVRYGRGTELVSTTSKSRPFRRFSKWSASLFHRPFGAPEMYHGEPLSARIIP